MKNLKTLREEFEAKNTERKALLEKGEALTAEEALQAQACVDRMAEIKTAIESVQRVDAARSAGDELEKWASAKQDAVPSGPVGGAFSNGVTLLGFTPAGQMVIDPRKAGLDILNFDRNGQPDQAFKAGAFKAAGEAQYKDAFRRGIAVGWHNLSNAEQAVLQEGIDTDGGYLAPEEILMRIIQKKPTPTRVSERVTRLTTSKDRLSIPKVNYTTDDLYTTGIRATWTGEVPASSTTHRATQPVFGQVGINIWTAMLSLPVTRDLVEDANFDLMGWLSAKFSETIELLRDNMTLNGTGVNQPSGILVNPNATNNPATVNTGSAAALTGDGLIDLTEAVPEQYDENSVLVFNKTNTGKAIRKLKDGDGRPLVNYGANDNGYASGRPKDINGYPYIWSGFMPNVGANTYPIIFGDLTGYYLVDRIGFSVQVLRELYAETNQLLLLGRVRFGGIVAEDWRLKIQKVAA